MPRIRNISRQARFVPAFGREVGADEVVEVPAPQLYAFTCQTSTWEPVGRADLELHEVAARAERERVAAYRG